MEIIIIILLILLNGFFALSEIALVSSKESKLQAMMKKGNKGAIHALGLLKNAENFLSAIQVGITLIGIITGVYGGINIAKSIEPIFAEISWIGIYAPNFSLALVVIIITYFSIVLGELVPKTIAISNPEKIACFVAPFIRYFSISFYPFVKLLSISTALINKLIGIKAPENKISEHELKHMIKLASFEGVIEEEQNEMHERIFYFSDKRAKHLMTPRVDVEWIDLNLPLQDIINKISKISFNKVVCAKGDLDHFEGTIIQKDFFKKLKLEDEINFDKILLKPIIIHENIDAKRILAIMREKRAQLLFVVNEYGGFEGIITLFDIIENIVGYVPDNGEVNEPDLFKREDSSYLVNGEAPVEVINQIIEDFDIDFEQIDYSTVAGFVLSKIDGIPQIGDRFNFLNYSFEIIDIDGVRVDKVLIKKLD